MGLQPIRVLLVSEDRALLRCAGTLLRICGCEVCQVASWQQAPAALASARHDFLILDAQPSLQNVLEISRSATARRARGELYTLLLTQSPGVDELYQALEAGVDDFLAKPVVYCELLARLRVGTRELELERRLAEQARVDPITGFANRRGLEGRLQRLVSAGLDQAATCVLMEVDFFSGVLHAFGRQAAEAVLQAIAAKLRELAGESAFLASLGGGRFALLVRDRTADDAADWADRLRQSWAEAETVYGDSPLHFTASFGVAGLDADITAEEILRQSAEALDLAQASGGNLVVRFGEFDQDEAWSALAAPGKIFEGAVARDVMTPLADELRADELASEADLLLRRGRLAALPAIDDEGKLLGIVTEDCLGEDGSAELAANATVGQIMHREVRCLDESASFAELIDGFRADAASPIVITHDGRPTGLVMPASLGLLGRKLSKEHLCATLPYSPRSEYLVVPDLGPE